MKSFQLLTTMAVLAIIVKDRLAIALDDTKFHNICRDESQVLESDIKQFIENGMKASDGKDTIKCYIKCLMEKQGVFKSGIYNAELGTVELLKIPQLKEHRAEVAKAVNMCKNEKGANECDTAFKITMCIKEFRAPQNA